MVACWSPAGRLWRFDDHLEPWLVRQRSLPLLDPVLGTRFGALEMIRLAITTGLRAVRRLS